MSLDQANKTLVRLTTALNNAVDKNYFMSTLLYYCRAVSVTAFDFAIPQKPTTQLQLQVSATSYPASSSGSGAVGSSNTLSGGAVAAIVICVLVVAFLSIYVANVWATRTKHQTPSSDNAQSMLSPGARDSRSSANGNKKMVSPSPTRKTPPTMSLDVASPVTSPYDRPSAGTSTQKVSLFSSVRDSLPIGGKKSDIGLGVTPDML